MRVIGTEHIGNVPVTKSELVNGYRDRDMGSKSTEVGRTGARFAGAGRQHGHHRAAETPAWPNPERYGAEPPEAEPTPPAQPVTGARFGPHYERRRVRDADSTPEFVPDPEPVRRSPVDERLPLESEVLIRPYARTGGRTKPNRTLALEALITTSSDLTGIAYRQWSSEHKMIANLCVRPR